jgi:hypothetical protein
VTFALNAQWGSLDNLLGGAKKLKANVTYKLSSPKLVLDPLMAASGGSDDGKAKAGDEAASGSGIQDLSATVPAGLTLKGSIDVDAMVCKQIKTGKFTNQLSLVKQKLSSATGLALYNGNFSERSNVDFSKSGPLFTSKLLLTTLKFDSLVDDAAASFPDSTAIQGFKGKVQGALGFSAAASGRGLKKPALMKNLKAAGFFTLQDGKIAKTDWQEKIASAIPHPQTQAVLRQDIVFQNLRGDFDYSAEKITLKTFALGSGSDWRGGNLFLQASGTLVPGGAVDFKVEPHFNPGSVQLGGEVGEAFNDDKGWPTYNYIAYYGPSTKEAKADFSKGLENAAKNAVNKKVDQAKQQATDAIKKQAQDKAGDLIKQLPGGLNKLFGQ